jgi:WD40 repeat protein
MLFEFNKIKEWNVEKKRGCLAIDRENKILAIGGEQDTRIDIWDIEKGGKINSWLIHEPLSHIPWENRIHTIDISHDGKLLANSGNTKIWNLHTGELVRNYKRWSNSAKFSPEKDILFSVSGEEILQWSTKKQKKIRRFSSSGAFDYMIFSPNGEEILVGDHYGDRIQAWNLHGDFKPRTMNIKDTGRFVSGGISSDGKILALCGRGIQLCDYQTGEQILLIDKSQYKRNEDCFKHVAGVGFLSISPNGEILATYGQDGCIRFWSTTTGENIAFLKTEFCSHIISNDWSKIVILLEDKIQIWDMKISDSL